MSKKKNRVTKGSSNKNLIIIASSFAIVVILLIVFNIKNNAQQNVEDNNITIGGDLTIMKSDITKQMKIYPYQSNDIYMEVMAVSASDGTIRTALNTCISCYNSGRGYYTQQGNTLTCQNCGTKFDIDQIEVIKDGCNPVPIAKDTQIEDDEKIVISEDSLVQYESLFKEWKK